MYIPRGTRENPRIPRRIAARSTYGYQPKEDQMMGDQLLDNAEAIITETSQIPDRWSYHPNCLETFGELCTHHEYNKRMQQRFRESTTDGWSTYIQGSGGID